MADPVIDQVARDHAAKVEADQHAHEETCAVRYTNIAANLDKLWEAIDAIRGRWVSFLLWLCGGLGVALLAAVGVIVAQLPKG